MGSIANRIKAATLAVACFAIVGSQVFAQAPASPPAPAKPAVPATYTGCVQKAPDSSTDLVISTPKVCALLTGSVSADKLAGHQVELTGVLTPRTSSVAASIQVNSVGSVGKACSEVCALKPPMSRGLHRPSGEIPGSEGGTPGVTSKPNQ